ncbi:MAG: sigma-70 family RNA polymerase sigma factor [Labilithrix sp.]|nr:sigma-70 family RNA polymerase sigma factor [Labilithrix sp.]MCW5815780.1 sigma-70 family RNA polymerase sigma factor [Labilithrix sp.]
MVSTFVPSALLHPPVGPALHVDARELRLVVSAVVAAILRERPDHADVEDCTNETLRRALEARADARGPARPWVIGIARHVALDALRARQRQRARSGGGAQEEAPPSSTGALVERLADPGAGADVQMERAESDARVRRVMTTLPDGPRRALELFHLEGLPYQEIARRLEVPLGTVATWVTRGRKAMAEALEDEVRR